MEGTDADSFGGVVIGGEGVLDLQALKGLLVGPCFDGQIGLGVEPNTQDHDGEEAGDVAGQFPVFPLAGLARGRGGPVEEVPLGPLLVARARPPAGTRLRPAAGSERLEDPPADGGGGGGEWRGGRHRVGFDLGGFDLSEGRVSET